MSLLIWAGLLLAAHPPRFDHLSEKHATVACNDCHDRSKSNGWGHVRFPKKDHKPCENAGCHAGKLVKFDPRKPEFCRTCHVAGPGGHGINIHKAVYPPYRSGEHSQFTLASSGHKTHVEAGKCEVCHTHDRAESGGPDMVFTGHRGCAGCHESKAKPAMATCNGCHVKKAPEEALASSTWSDYRVSNLFTHASHAKKTGKNECASCHVNAKVEKGVHTPLPAMADCTSCHDGDQAFDAVGSQCRRCHESAQISEAQPPTKEQCFFSHVRHADQNVVGPTGAYVCVDCHPTTERGRLWFPAGGRNFDPKEQRNGHWPCEKCHQQQFLTRESKGICRVCHEHSDPWRANPVKERFRSEREMASDLPHAKHDKTACDKCHYEQSGAEKPAIAGGLMAPGHELCAQCHETLKTQPMTKCEGCHRTLKPEEQPTKWAVTEKFKHETHRVDVRTAKVIDAAALGWKRADAASAKKLDCAVCHQQIDGGQNPRMQTCRTCHDGTLAFKDTGFACARCHGPVDVEGKGS